LKILAIDLETKPVGDKPDPYQDDILLTSVVTDEGNEYIFERLQYPDWLLEALEDPHILKLAHNASFEWKFINHNFNVSLENIWDTYAVERVLTAGTGVHCDLESVALRRLNKQLNKAIRERFRYGAMGPKEKEYCLEDSRVLFPIYDQQLRAVKENGQLFAAELENKVSVIVGAMELHGICFDKDLWESYIPLMQQRMEQAQRVVWKFLDMTYSQDMFSGITGGVPLTSRDKVLEALKRKGIKLADYQSHTLQEYLLRTENQKHATILKALLDFKQWEKALGWDYPQYIHPLTGRIHASFHATGADTFRFTSSKPNLQQVAKPFEDINFRHLFTAQPGYQIVGADYSQIELRLLAVASGEDHYLESFINGEDMHTYMAESILGRKLQSKDERNLGKAVNFGVAAYGGSVPALQGQALEYGFLISEKDAKRYVRRIKETNPKVEKWGKKVLRQMKAKGYIQTPMGHRRRLRTEDRESVARNTTIQVQAAGIMKLGMVKLFEKLKGKDARIWLQVHDEVASECPIDLVEEVSDLTETSLLAAWNEWITEVPMQVDVYISNSWEK
jgi:DNA polymerase-1